MSCSPTLLRFVLRSKAACFARRPVPTVIHRTYATPKNHVHPSILSNVLDHKARQTNREASVGPFQWGVTQPAIDYNEKVKKWSELTTSGKGVLMALRILSIMHTLPVSCSGENDRKDDEFCSRAPRCWLVWVTHLLVDIGAVLQKLTNGIV